jgi:DNA polymerase-3 subunit beta
MVATDGYRLAVSEQIIEEALDEDIEVVIPGKSLEELTKMISGNEDVRISLTKNQILFSFENTLYLTLRFEGRFPNHEQFITNEYITKCIISHDELLASVNRVSVLAANNEKLEFTVSSEKQSISLLTNAQDLGQAEDSVFVKVEGGDNKTAVNISYLKDGLMSMASDTVIIELRDPQNPMIVKAPEENYLYVVMPVRLK